MEKVALKLSDLSCPDCAAKIGQAVSRMKGVAHAEVIFTTSKLKVEYDPAQVGEEEIARTVSKFGYRVVGRA